MTPAQRRAFLRKFAGWLAGAYLAFQPSLATSQPTETDELALLAQEWMQALERKDRGRLERILHEDFLIMGMADAKPPVTREQWLENGLDKSSWSDFRYENLNVTVLGDVAVVRSTLHFTAKRSTGVIRQLSTASPLVDVWVKDDGRWQVIRRYPAPWAAKRWLDRGVGFLSGAAVITILGFLWARRMRRRTLEPGRSTDR